MAAAALNVSVLNTDKPDHHTPQAEAEEFLRFVADKPVDGPDVVSSLVLLGKVLSMQVIRFDWRTVYSLFFIISCAVFLLFEAANHVVS